MDCKKLPMFYFLWVAFSRCLIIKGSLGILCLFANSSRIYATNLENNIIEKEPLTTETATENCFAGTKKMSETKVHRKRLTKKDYIENLKYTLGFFIVLILFINWLLIGFRFLYVFGICGLLFFFIVRQAENIDYSKLTFSIKFL